MTMIQMTSLPRRRQGLQILAATVGRQHHPATTTVWRLASIRQQLQFRAASASTRSVGKAQIPIRTRTRKPLSSSSSSSSTLATTAAPSAASSLHGTNIASSSTTTTTTTTLLNAPRQSGRNDDALARYPHWRSPGGILRGLDYLGTLTFALTGSVTAAQSGLDVFGASIVAMITAVGGGTIRDAVLLAKVPFWTSETEYIWMTVVTGCVTFFTWPHVLEWQQQRQEERERKAVTTTGPESAGGISTTLATSSIQHTNDDSDRSSDEKTTASSEECGDRNESHQSQSYNNNNNNNNNKHKHNNSYDELDGTLDTLDAIGLSAFAIIGAQNGVRAGMPMVVSAICGMATSTFGGMCRDVLCARPVRIVHSNAEVYAPPALLGALTYLVALKGKLRPGWRLGSAFLVCMGSRYLAVTYNIKMHTWENKENPDGLGVAIRK